MQTFLPYADFRRSAESLDSARLGKQRVETLQILRALELPEYGWANHPAVTMWRGYTPALVRYGLDCVEVWKSLGHADSTESQIAEFAPEVVELSQDDLAAQGQLPSWVENESLHMSHRSKLIAKDPEFYEPEFPGTPVGLDYVWPGPDAEVPPRQPVAEPNLWIVRPSLPEMLGVFVDAGVVGLGAEAGVSVAAAGTSIADIAALAGIGGKRPGKALLALHRLVESMATGDEVGVLIDGGKSMLVGPILGDYQFVPRAPQGLIHQRSVSWQRLILRSAVRPPAALQDVRSVFRVYSSM